MSTILITGANGNLGPAVVKRLLKDNYRVFAVNGSKGGGKPSQDERLENIEADLSDEAASFNLITSLIRKEPGLQAAILLVGGFASGKIQDTDDTLLGKMIILNFYTAFHIIRPLMPYFLNRPEGGQFILVGSRPALNSSDGKNVVAYALSKSLVFKLAEIINAEGKDRNVTATVIVPATIDTKSNREAMPAADFSKWVPPENIADSISFTLSHTGQMLRENIIKIYNRS
jgi:NAD(P)-dependent dehydrogenase (short-subunit alcohol dehydrogenase family)